MIRYKKIIMTLALLITAVTGAWAQTAFGVKEITADMLPASWSTDNSAVTADDLAKLGFMEVTKDAAKTWTGAPQQGTVRLVYTLCESVNWVNGQGGYVSTYDSRKGFYECLDGQKIFITTELTEWPLTSQDGKVWTLAKMPANDVELQVAYFPGMLTLAQAEHGSIEVVGLGEPIVAELTDIDGWKNDPTLLSAADLPGFVAISEDIAKTWNHTPASFMAEALYYGFDGDDVEQIMFEDGAVFTRKGTITRDVCYQTVKIVESHIYYTTGVKMPAGFDTDGTNYYVEAGTQFQVKAVPAEGYRLVKLMAGETDITDKVDADGIATVTMPEGDADLTLTATFSDEYDIAFQAANALTIEAGKATVKVGDTDKTADIQDGKLSVKSGQTVTLNAATGYKIKKVEVKKASKLLSITISGVTVYYAEGDSWADAIKRDENKNSGLFIREGNRVHHPTYGQLVDSNTQPVLPDAKINANESYRFIN